jgi:hypothetical protein
MVVLLAVAPVIMVRFRALHTPADPSLAHFVTDPGANTWHIMTPMPCPHTCASVHNDQLYVYGRERGEPIHSYHFFFRIGYL